MAMVDQPSQIRGLARATSLNLVGSAVAALSMLALLLVLTKGFGQGRAGVFLSAVALFQVLSIAATLGVETGLVKFISGRAHVDSRISNKDLLSISLIPVAGLSSLLTVLMVVWSSQIGSFIGGSALAAEATGVISMMAWFILPASISYGLLGATRGYGTMRPTVVVDRIGRSGLQVLFAGAAMISGNSLQFVAVAWALPYILELVAVVGWLISIQRKDASSDQDSPAWFSAFMVFWRFTLPRAAASIFRATFQWFDVILVAGLASPEAAAVYAVATRLLQLGLLAAFSVGQAVEPRFGKTIAAGDLVTTRSLYAISTAWLIILTWPMYILLAIFASSALGVFGSGFVTGSTALVILSGSVILGAGVGPVDILLVMKGKSTWSLWNTGLAAGLSIVLNLLLIPRLGIVGAAISLATSRVVANLLPLAQLNHLAHLHPFGDIWVRAALTSSLIFGGVGLIAKFTLGSSLTAAITAGALALIAYVPVLWRSRSVIGLDPKILLGRGSIA
jgi:O-antigen/teichoic acid export membrane protein